MIEIRTYRGHIRNWKALVRELGIEGAEKLSRQEREPLILEKAYEKWGHEMGLHMHGMFALALWDAETTCSACAIRSEQSLFTIAWRKTESCCTGQ